MPRQRRTLTVAGHSSIEDPGAELPGHRKATTGMPPERTQPPAATGSSRATAPAAVAGPPDADGRPGLKCDRRSNRPTLLLATPTASSTPEGKAGQNLRNALGACPDGTELAHAGRGDIAEQVPHHGAQLGAAASRVGASVRPGAPPPTIVDPALACRNQPRAQVVNAGRPSWVGTGDDRVPAWGSQSIKPGVT